MSSIIKKVEQKLGDHPNVNDDPTVNPSKGTGNGANDGHDSGKSWVQNTIEAGQGSGKNDPPSARAGSTTSADTVSAATASGAIANGERAK